MSITVCYVSSSAGPRRKLLDPPRCFRVDGPVRGVQMPALLPFLPGDHWQVLKLVRPLALQKHELIFRSVYQHGRSGNENSECTKVTNHTVLARTSYLSYDSLVSTGPNNSSGSLLRTLVSTYFTLNLSSKGYLKSWPRLPKIIYWYKSTPPILHKILWFLKVIP